MSTGKSNLKVIKISEASYRILQHYVKRGFFRSVRESADFLIVYAHSRIINQPKKKVEQVLKSDEIKTDGGMPKQKMWYIIADEEYERVYHVCSYKDLDDEEIDDLLYIVRDYLKILEQLQQYGVLEIEAARRSAPWQTTKVYP